MIRGGKEYGLGIYVTQVDPGSPVHESGLRVGEQILDAGGVSFLDITHAEACKQLKNSSGSSILTVKSVGCIPHGRAKYDQTQWLLNSPQTSRRSRDSNRGSPHNSIGQASGSSINTSASEAAAKVQSSKTRSASPLAQLSHLAARLPTPSSIKLKRKNKKNKLKMMKGDVVSRGSNSATEDNEPSSARSNGSESAPEMPSFSQWQNSNRPLRPQSSPLLMMQMRPPSPSLPMRNPSPPSLPTAAFGDSLDPSPIFHKGLGSQINLSMDRGTILARTKDMISEQASPTVRQTMLRNNITNQ
jgi:hypothetical protein